MTNESFILTSEELQRLLNVDLVAGDDDAVKLIERLKSGPELKPNRRGDKVSIGAAITSEALDGLREVAMSLGLWHGGSGNISGLLQLIGEGKLKVIR